MLVLTSTTKWVSRVCPISNKEESDIRQKDQAGYGPIIDVACHRGIQRGAILAVEAQQKGDGVSCKPEFQGTRQRIIPRLPILQKPIGVAISVE